MRLLHPGFLSGARESAEAADSLRVECVSLSDLLGCSGLARLVAMTQQGRESWQVGKGDALLAPQDPSASRRLGVRLSSRLTRTSLNRSLPQHRELVVMRDAWRRLDRHPQRPFPRLAPELINCGPHARIAQEAPHYAIPKRKLENG